MYGELEVDSDVDREKESSKGGREIWKEGGGEECREEESEMAGRDECKEEGRQEHIPAPPPLYTEYGVRSSVSTRSLKLSNAGPSP